MPIGITPKSKTKITGGGLLKILRVSAKNPSINLS